MIFLRRYKKYTNTSDTSDWPFALVNKIVINHVLLCQFEEPYFNNVFRIKTKYTSKMVCLYVDHHTTYEYKILPYDDKQEFPTIQIKIYEESQYNSHPYTNELVIFNYKKRQLAIRVVNIDIKYKMLKKLIKRLCSVYCKKRSCLRKCVPIITRLYVNGKFRIAAYADLDNE
jgi:hypothetical protein